MVLFFMGLKLFQAIILDGGDILAKFLQFLAPVTLDLCEVMDIRTFDQPILHGLEILELCP